MVGSANEYAFKDNQRTTWLSLFTAWQTMCYSLQGQPDSLFVKTAFLLPVSHLYNMFARTRTQKKLSIINCQLNLCYPCATAFGIFSTP